ncbi:MAG: DUF1080 domain-containing protein [Kiritimatiellae bacterium]|nr:DUF1080 domain-containing protein [Kiritimatiellia bacterium]MDD5521738.1 DUF1080 domain-containing protein [Kiritimatiellia bacterium]
MKRFVSVTCSFLCVVVLALSADQKNPFLGHWALTIPGGGAGWLGVAEESGVLKGSVLWGGGSVLPVDSVKLEGDALIVIRSRDIKSKGADGKEIKVKLTETITAKLEGDDLKLSTVSVRSDGKSGGNKADFTGKRIPPVPSVPDLSKVKFGEPVKLFNGTNLDGWNLLNPNAPSGWSVKDGVLNNDPKQEEGKPRKHYTNLRTVQEFEDFNLTLEVNVPKGGNSGIYLRGIYEVQVSDSYGRNLDAHNMGGIYSRIAPTVAAEKPAGEWQTFDITLVDRHVTVILNGKKIIDNQPLLGCTGGALWSDQFKPGPIYLQGDHTGVNYRNIILRPVVK